MSMEIREFDPQRDRPYVIKCWIGAIAPDDPRRKFERGWKSELDADIKTALTRGMKILIAYDSDYPAVVCGWIAFGPGPVLHFVYVGNQLRRQGIAKALIDAAQRDEAGGKLLMVYSHQTASLKAARAFGLQHFNAAMFPPPPRPE